LERIYTFVGLTEKKGEGGRKKNGVRSTNVLPGALVLRQDLDAPLGEQGGSDSQKANPNDRGWGPEKKREEKR